MQTYTNFLQQLLKAGWCYLVDKRLSSVLKVPLTPKYFFTKMNLCTHWKHIVAIFFHFLTIPAFL